MNEVVARLSEIRDSLPPDEILLAVDERSVWVRVGSVWEKQADRLPEEHPDYHICLCTLPDGIVAVGGGWRDNMSSMYHHFSVHTRTWKRLPDMPTARCFASAVVLGNVLMVLGGWDKHYHELAVCEKFHMTDGAWSSAASMIEPLIKPLVAAAGNKIYIVPRDKHISPSTKIQQYGPTADRFSTTSQLPQHVLSQPPARYDRLGCCGVVHNDKLLLCGGRREGAYATNLVEEFDINTQQWKITDVKLPFSFSFIDSHVASIHV